MKPLIQIKPDLNKIPGGWEPDTNLSLDINTCTVKYYNLDIIVCDNFLTNNDVDKLITLMDSAPKMEKVGINGFMDEDEMFGSRRVTMWSPELAEHVYAKIIHNNILKEQVFTKYCPTDWWQGDKTRTNWTPYNASPMMRFMKYEKNGEHYAHYDAGYIYPDDNYRTLKSYVIYLTDAEEDEGGATRFILDNQAYLPVWERKHEDWTRRVRGDEVFRKVRPKKGRILFFDHRRCHDVEEYLGLNRRIIRGDIIYTHTHTHTHKSK